MTLPPALGVSNGLAETIIALIDSQRSRLVQVSRAIHNNPELSFHEAQAAALLETEAELAGFKVERGICDLPTAFRASYGRGDFSVAICAEYDALPRLGHACGHNLIAAAALGAALSLAAVAERLGIRVLLLGTPAEEHGGGKSIMLERGAWDDATISLMVHGTSGTFDYSCRLAKNRAVDRFDVVFGGSASHAASAPWQGVNASDAAAISQVSLGLLRQQLHPSVRVNAFVAEGGLETNIIADRTRLSVEVRAEDLETLENAKKRVIHCFAGAATATGCTWSQETTEPRYEPLIQNPVLASAWDASMRSLGRTVVDEPAPIGGSTDMGNVSQTLPAIQPWIAILGSSAPGHSMAFARDAISEAGEQAAIDGAKALALTVASVVSAPDVRALLQEERRKSRRTLVR